jgi:hypothetical protein
MDNGAPRVKAACRLSSDKIIARPMKDRPTKPAAKGEGDRAARLAEALRANLHRRKAQARAVEQTPDDPEKSAQ